MPRLRPNHLCRYCGCRIWQYHIDGDSHWGVNRNQIHTNEGWFLICSARYKRGDIPKLNALIYHDPEDNLLKFVHMALDREEVTT